MPNSSAFWRCRRSTPRFSGSACFLLKIRRSKSCKISSSRRPCAGARSCSKLASRDRNKPRQRDATVVGHQLSAKQTFCPPADHWHHRPHSLTSTRSAARARGSAVKRLPFRRFASVGLSEREGKRGIVVYIKDYGHHDIVWRCRSVAF